MNNHLSLFKTNITSNTIKSLLHAIKHGHKLPKSALTNLDIVKEEIPDGMPKPVRDHLLTEWVTQRITCNLNTLRKIHNLKPVNASDTHDVILEKMRSDFSLADVRLEAWSALYVAFVRVDITYTNSELAKIALVSPRTLRRRRQRGCELLLVDIMKAELSFDRRKSA